MTESPGRSLQLTLDGPAQLSTVRATIRTWLAHGVDRHDLDDILLAAGEALANALEHGHPPVDVRMQFAESQTLAVFVKDAGQWTPSVPRPNRGRGVQIMTALMDDVTIDTTGGTTVGLTRNVRRAD